MSTELNDRVTRLLQNLIDAGEEVGLQVAAYHRGRLVVDAWAGLADEATGRKVDGETLFTSLSTTKGWVTTCAHILADRGKLQYEDPIAEYWPEFAAHGKAQVTVRHVLTHTAGVPKMPANVTPEMMCDWNGMCDAIASQSPIWEPGAATGYHGWTFGWIVGELVRRVDGRPISQFVQDEVCKPLGIHDFYLGIPDGVEARVATLRDEPMSPKASPPTREALLDEAIPPHVTSAEVLNRPDVRRAVIPGAGGIMSAKAVARHYAMLAECGELDGVRVLSRTAVDQARKLQTDDVDKVLGRQVRKGLGYWLGGPEHGGGSVAMGSPGAFGHPGVGGSIGFADPERRLSFGLTKTLLKKGADPQKRASTIAAEEIRHQLDALDTAPPAARSSDAYSAH